MLQLPENDRYIIYFVYISIIFSISISISKSIWLRKPNSSLRSESIILGYPKIILVYFGKLLIPKIQIMRLINFRTTELTVNHFLKVIKLIKHLHKNLPYLAVCIIETKHTYSIRFHIVKSKIYPSQRDNVILNFKRLISMLKWRRI